MVFVPIICGLIGYSKKASLTPPLYVPDMAAVGKLTKGISLLYWDYNYP